MGFPWIYLALPIVSQRRQLGTKPWAVEDAVPGNLVAHQVCGCDCNGQPAGLGVADQQDAAVVGLGVLQALLPVIELQPSERGPF